MLQEAEWAEDFNLYFVPITKSVALVFMSLTLVVHLVVPSTRASVVGKITTVMISLNIIIILNRLVSSGLELETGGCVVSGYIAQFTPLSLFCFLFCMALDIFIKFRKMDPHTDTGLEKKKFAASVFASLLVPLIICSVTAMVDASSDGLSHHDLLSYPQMGVFGCFLGSARTNGNLHLLLRPEFIYFFFWIISLMLGSGFLMVWTSHMFCSHVWRHQGMGEGQAGIVKKLSQQFIIVMKLQGIFVILSFPWIFEITHYAYKNDGKDIGDVLSIVGDSWNLISSIALFFFVFRNQTKAKFNEKIHGLASSTLLSGELKSN